MMRQRINQRLSMFWPCLLWMMLLYTTHVSAADSVHIDSAWIRSSKMQTTAAYMQIRSTQAVTLISAHTDVADSAEIHTMSMRQGVMHMAMLGKLPIPAKKTMVLAPGGVHIMLFGLKRTLKIGEMIPLELCFLRPDQSYFTVLVQATVRSQP